LVPRWWQKVAIAVGGIVPVLAISAGAIWFTYSKPAEDALAPMKALAA
jgi:hypothetical protein